jgi:hypothetical protein
MGENFSLSRLGRSFVKQINLIERKMEILIFNFF